MLSINLFMSSKTFISEPRCAIVLRLVIISVRSGTTGATGATGAGAGDGAGTGTGSGAGAVSEIWVQSLPKIFS